MKIRRRLAITNKTSNDIFIASVKKWKEKNHDVAYLDYYVLNEGMSLLAKHRVKNHFILQKKIFKTVKNYIPIIPMNISFDDLKASNFLYKNGFYPQAIFYLQQTIEKLIKSNGYYLNIIKNRKIGEKNVRHDVWKVYCNILENLSNSKFEKIFNK